MILGGQPPGKVGRREFFIWPHGQEVKTSPFHGGNPGSIPGGVTIKGLHQCAALFLSFKSTHYQATVAELADAQDLGSCGNTVQVRFLSVAPLKKEGSALLFPWSGKQEGIEP